MPLLHDSRSHGPIAFGFYNIDCDGLLLDRLFFFCTDFCRAVADLSATGAAEMPGHEFGDAAAIGDLHGAISGTRHTGYLGESYRRWPFPEDQAAFRQHLDGHRHQAEVAAMLDRHASRTPIFLTLGDDLVAIGAYRFSPQQFAALLAYVWRGGYPTWQDGARPDHVAALAGFWPPT